MMGHVRPHAVPAPSIAPAPATCGLIRLLEAVLHDAATDLARIERAMAAGGDDTSTARLGLAAVAVVDRAGRLVQTQRGAILERLAAGSLDSARRL
jgi:hypothetical protein